MNVAHTFVWLQRNQLIIFIANTTILVVAQQTIDLVAERPIASISNSTIPYIAQTGSLWCPCDEKKPGTEIMSKSPHTWWHESLNVDWTPNRHLKSQFLTPLGKLWNQSSKTDGKNAWSSHVKGKTWHANYKQIISDLVKWILECCLKPWLSSQVTIPNSP